MMYVEAPAIYQPDDGDTSVFLAGGISGCPDWQQDMVKFLQDTELVLLNPRRADFPIHDPDAAKEQIAWEYRHLRKATAVLFWFPCETLCPIVLYELGAWSMTGKPIFVGVHPDYKRRRDVEIQTGLARPEVEIVYSLEELAAQVMRWARRIGIMLKILTLLLALVLLAARTRPAPEPNPACYDLQIICGGYSETVSVRSHWTEMRPPALELLCYVKCGGTRACVSTDGCTWLKMR